MCGQKCAARKKNARSSNTNNMAAAQGDIPPPILYPTDAEKQAIRNFCVCRIGLAEEKKRIAAATAAARRAKSAAQAKAFEALASAGLSSESPPILVKAGGSVYAVKIKTYSNVRNVVDVPVVEKALVHAEKHLKWPAPTARIVEALVAGLQSARSTTREYACIAKSKKKNIPEASSATTPDGVAEAVRAYTAAKTTVSNIGRALRGGGAATRSEAANAAATPSEAADEAVAPDGTEAVVTGFLRRTQRRTQKINVGGASYYIRQRAYSTKPRLRVVDIREIVQHAVGQLTQAPQWGRDDFRRLRGDGIASAICEQVRARPRDERTSLVLHRAAARRRPDDEATTS